MNEPLNLDELRLRTEEEIVRELNVPPFMFKRLRRKRLIPFVELGYRTYRYDLLDVRRALEKLKRRSVA